LEEIWDPNLYHEIGAVKLASFKKILEKVLKLRKIMEKSAVIYGIVAFDSFVTFKGKS